MPSASQQIPQFDLITGWREYYGQWDTTDPQAVKYAPTKEDDQKRIGLIVASELSMDDGSAKATVLFESRNEDACAGIAMHVQPDRSFYVLGLGGWGKAYTIVRHEAGRTTLLEGAGDWSNIYPNKSYELEARIDGRQIALFVDGDSNPTISYSDPSPLPGATVGVAAWRSNVLFGNLKATKVSPKVFVVMDFAPGLREVYEVIKSASEQAGFECFREDDVHLPMNEGVIIHDIQRNLNQSRVVLAEVSSQNPNVYYEIGFAHALGKHVILLAERRAPVHFNIQGYQRILYSNEIGGQSQLAHELQRRLKEVKQRPEQ